MGYRTVKMSEELFTMFMTEGHQVPSWPGKRVRVVKGLPPGAKLELVSMDVFFMQGIVALRYSHPSWDNTPPGHAIPELDIQIVIEDDVTSDLTPMEEAVIRLGR